MSNIYKYYSFGYFLDQVTHIELMMMSDFSTKVQRIFNHRISKYLQNSCWFSNDANAQLNFQTKPFSKANHLVGCDDSFLLLQIANLFFVLNFHLQQAMLNRYALKLQITISSHIAQKYYKGIALQYVSIAPLLYGNSRKVQLFTNIRHQLLIFFVAEYSVGVHLFEYEIVLYSVTR